MIKITEKLYMSSNGNQYILGERTEVTRKDGTTRTALRNASYHASIGAAVNSAIRKTMMGLVAEESITTLRGFIEQEKSITAEIRKMVGQ